ncbi:MAG: hypothetical protein IJF54_00920 [Clostridia bacterium]|nr:hypothetical protein [Clostridia bacterium]
MKRVLSLILAMMLVFALASCTDTPDTDANGTTTTTAQSAQETTALNEGDGETNATTQAVGQTQANSSIATTTAVKTTAGGNNPTTTKAPTTKVPVTTKPQPTTTKPLPQNVDYSAKDFDVNKLGTSLRVVGRAVNADNKVTAQFTDGGVEFNLICKGDVTIKINWTRGPGLLGVVINNDEQNVTNYKITTSTKEVTIAKGLKAGRYTFKVIKLNEVSLNTFNFLGVKFNGILGDKATQRKIKIEAYGDSITCGLWNMLDQHGVDGYEQGYYQDGYSTYVGFAARNLGADLSVVARSGWGLIHSPYGLGYDGAIPKIWDQILPSTIPDLKWDFSSYVPDVVVVNLGTNDKTSGKPTAMEMSNEVKRFSKELRSKYPKCAIIWVTGMMGDFGGYTASMQAAVKQLKDDKIKFVSLPYNTSGGQWHPNLAGHKAAGAALQAEIEKILGL